MPVEERPAAPTLQDTNFALVVEDSPRGLPLDASLYASPDIAGASKLPPLTKPQDLTLLPVPGDAPAAATGHTAQPAEAGAQPAEAGASDGSAGHAGEAAPAPAAAPSQEPTSTPPAPAPAAAPSREPVSASNDEGSLKRKYVYADLPEELRADQRNVYKQGFTVSAEDVRVTVDMRAQRYKLKKPDLPKKNYTWCKVGPLVAWADIVESAARVQQAAAARVQQ
jgi:hypothetical protein